MDDYFRPKSSNDFTVPHCKLLEKQCLLGLLGGTPSEGHRLYNDFLFHNGDLLL